MNTYALTYKNEKARIEAESPYHAKCLFAEQNRLSRARFGLMAVFLIEPRPEEGQEQ